MVLHGWRNCVRRNQIRLPHHKGQNHWIPLAPQLPLFRAVTPPKIPGMFIEGSTRFSVAWSRIRITLSIPDRRIKYINSEFLLYNSKVIMVLL